MVVKPQAQQEYVRAGKVRRTATCPEHDRRSSDFRGIQQDMMSGKYWWAFACKGREGHIFLAVPDGSAPGDVEAVSGWELRQEQVRAGMEQH